MTERLSTLRFWGIWLILLLYVLPDVINLFIK